MRVARWTIPTVLAVASFPGWQICHAQPGSAIGSAPTTSIGGCTGLPYSGKETHTNIITKADGTTAEHTDVHRVWRDADGRTRDELILNAGSSEYRSVFVYEPVKRVRWTWFYGGSSKNVVRVEHFGEQERSPLCPSPPTPQAKSNPGDFTVEFLPPDTINGIPVVHNRNTKVVAAGAVGNDRELILTREFWTSRELGVVMRHTIDDPRHGKIVVELSDVSRADPDPALFKVPEGYEMREVLPPTPTVMGQIMRDIKPAVPLPPSK